MKYKFNSSIYLKPFDKILFVGILFQGLNALFWQSRIVFLMLCGIMALVTASYGHLFFDSRGISITINDSNVVFGLGKEDKAIPWNEIRMITIDREKNVYVHEKGSEDLPLPIPSSMENIDGLIGEFAKYCKKKDIIFRIAIF